MDKEQQPATKADVAQFTLERVAMPRLTQQLKHFENSLLTAFHNHGQEVSIHSRNIEAGLSNLRSTLARMEAVEQRVLAIEMRLPQVGGQ